MVLISTVRFYWTCPQIGASGSGFIFLEPPIRLADSQFANRVLGQSSNLSGYKKSPKSLIYKGFGRCALASLAGFEPTAFRLGGERSILLSYRDLYEIELVTITFGFELIG